MINRIQPIKWPAFALCAFLVACHCDSVNAQHVANSLAELRTLSSLSNATITLAPGDYWINGDHISNPTGSEPIFLELGGNGNTYNLSGANLKLDTRKLDGFGRALGHGSGVRVVKLSGSNNTVQGLSLTGYDLDLDTDPNAQRYADWGAVYVQMTGASNTMQGVNVLTRGSANYGLGDAFGKGASGGTQPFLGHRKASAFNVFQASDAVVNDMHLDVNTFGHGFFVQESTDTTLTNSTVTGELFPSSNVINHPLYQQYGHTFWGNPIQDDIMISGAEAGVRMYTGASGLTVEDVVVTNMRTGFGTALASGNILLKNVESYGAETGFGIRGNTTIINGKGDIVNGPLVSSDRASSTTVVDVELVGGVPVGVDWAVINLNGSGADITITSDLALGELPAGSLLRFGQADFNNWRNRDSPASFEDGADPLSNAIFTNNTNQMVMFGADVTGVTGSSLGAVITNGKDNAYDGISIVLNGTKVVLTDTKGLGNNGTAADGSLETNASIVSDGATLEVEAGLRIQNEKLTITGDGVDGLGALYSEGSADSNTRFGSSNNNDESTIFLNGDSSIGVGVAGNQLLVGRIQGVGDLTKRGAGTLTMGKSSTYDGDLIVAEGRVVARPGVIHNNLTVMAGASISGIGNNAFNTADGVVQLDGTLDLNGRTDGNSLSGRIGLLNGSGRVTSSNSFAGSGGTLDFAGDMGSGVYSGTIDGLVNVIKSGSSEQSFNGNMTHTGTTTVTAGSLFVNGTHSGGGDYTVSGGALGGTGVIQSNVSNNGGKLAAGSSSSLGLLTIGGNYAQSSGSAMAFDIQNVSTYDRVNIGGTASLAGGLELNSTNPSQYQVGDNITLLDSVGQVTGKFDSISGISVGNVGGDDAGLAVQYVGNRVEARVTLMGDADFSDTVDNSDIGAVFGSFGAVGTPEWSEGNFDGNSVVDNADIGTVFGNFGSSTMGSLDPSVADLNYNSRTGQVVLDGTEAAGDVITNFVLRSDSRFINTDELSNPFSGVFFTANSSEISASDPLTNGLSRIDLGNVLEAGLTNAQLFDVFGSATYVGSLGTGVQNFDIVSVPEPNSVAVLALGLGLAVLRRRKTASLSAF